MRCDPFRERLGAYADGEVGGELRASLELHLETCSPCRTELAALRALGNLLEELPAPAPPEGLDASILKEASRIRPLPGRAGSLWPILARAAAVILVALTALVLGMRSSGISSPPPAQVPQQSVTGSAEELYAGSFELLPPDSPGAQYLSLLQEEGR